MSIYSQVMFLYGMTFLISMFVALVIWVFARIIAILDDEHSFLKKRQNP